MNSWVGHSGLRRLLDHLGEGILQVQEDGTISFYNNATQVLLSLGELNLHGRNLYESLRPSVFHDIVREVRAGSEPVLREFKLYGPQERILRVRGVSEVDLDSAVLLIQDITGEHRYERLRRDFLCNVSHEFKSPLTSICSLTETLLQGALSDPQVNRKFVQLVEQDAKRLSRLVHESIDLSQLESGGYPIRPVQVYPHQICKELIALRQVVLGRKPQTVENLIPQDMRVFADPDRLHQVLDNLLENAIHYTPPASRIQIGARCESTRTLLWVCDEGPGIPSAERLRIFERFYRLDKTRSRDRGGTGLGLSIVKHIVEAHGGKVWVEDSGQGGSQFSFTLPNSVSILPVQASVSLASPGGPPEGASHNADLSMSSFHAQLTAMGGWVEQSVGKAVQACIFRDAGLARSVLELDVRIDQAEVALDRLGLDLLSSSSLQRSEITEVVMGLKVTTELERMGDLALGIAHHTLDLLHNPGGPLFLEVQTLGERVCLMVQKSLNSLIGRDLEQAREVCGSDGEVDSLKRRFSDILLESLAAHQTLGPQAFALLVISRNLERIADHATNIAESTIFLVTGRTPKHGRLEQNPQEFDLQKGERS